MTTAEFIIALFYRIDNQMCIVPKHPQAALYPSACSTTKPILRCSQVDTAITRRIRQSRCASPEY